MSHDDACPPAIGAYTIFDTPQDVCFKDHPSGGLCLLALVEAGEGCGIMHHFRTDRSPILLSSITVVRGRCRDPNSCLWKPQSIAREVGVGWVLWGVGDLGRCSAPMSLDNNTMPHRVFPKIADTDVLRYLFSLNPYRSLLNCCFNNSVGAIQPP